MQPVHLFLTLIVVGGVFGAWAAQRLRYGPGQFAALVALATAASAVIAWILVVVLGLGPAAG